MLGTRAVLTIIGIISGCCLAFFLLAWCIVSYRRYQQRKDPGYVAASQADDEQRNVNENENANRTTINLPSDSPPPYSEAIRHLNNN